MAPALSPGVSRHAHLLHRRFIDAGADIVLTNSFGGNRCRLALHKAAARVAELNEQRPR